MRMTHQEARDLIQRDADEALHAPEKQMLSVHLEQCAECRAYAAELRELETVLVPLMRKQWTLVPPPHLIASIQAKHNFKVALEAILPMRTIAVGMVLLAFMFSTWQFTLSGRQSFAPALPAAVLPIPTPSQGSTNTRTAAPACEQLHYRVQANDTLESIARRFTVSQEELVAANHLQVEAVAAGRELLVPLCNFTPTSTRRPVSFSTRYTPSLSPIASTPGG